MVRAGIELNKTALGIELGSTRIKAVLIDSEHRQIASGTHAWEERATKMAYGHILWMISGVVCKAALRVFTGCVRKV